MIRSRWVGVGGSGDYWKIIDAYLVIIGNCRKEGRKEGRRKGTYIEPPEGPG